MKRLLLKAAVAAFALAVFVSSAFAYTYFLVENLYTPTWANWTVTGSMTPSFYSTGGYGGLGYGNSGQMLSNYALASDVSVTVRGTNNTFGLYVDYINQLAGGTQVQTYYWVNIAGNGGSIELYKQYFSSYPSTSLVYLTGTTLSFGDNSVVRVVTRQDAAISTSTDVIVFVNNSLALWYQDTNPTGNYGQAELEITSAANSSDLLTQISLGPISTVTPTAVPLGSISTSASTNQVNISWAAATESASGTGVWGYQLLRNGKVVATTTALSFVDTAGIVPDTTYAYTLLAIDYHWNTASTSFNVTTPSIPTSPPYPSTTQDGRRVGVRAAGAYWGGASENIDVLSGNLNFAIPLLKAMGRTGWSVPINLVYNSQIWRQDSGGAWNFGEDVGYGYGWKLLAAGAITPVWNPGGMTAAYYLFTDSNGAEYRLDQNTSNIWSSKESIYVWFDANSNILHLRDGSFWTFGCISAGTEPDSGVMHPTIIEDTNGNQVFIRYQTALGAAWANSSARISQIEDVRATSRGGGVYGTYDFSYGTGTIPHLNSISNSIATGEAYSFVYNTGIAVASPINGQSFGTSTFLDHISLPTLSQFVFQQSTGGELTKVTFPYGGNMSYVYGTTGYPSGANYRELTTRSLSPDGTTIYNYSLVHESPATGVTHQLARIADPSGIGEKFWAFGTTGVSVGLVTQYQGRQVAGGPASTQNDFTWTQDSTGNSYISNNVTTLDPGESYQAQKATAQTVDVHGNVTQVQNYSFGSTTGALARTYNYTYLTGTGYSSRYIFNRLLSASATPAGLSAITLASNVYDVYATGGLGGGCGQAAMVTAGSGIREWDSTYTVSSLTRGNIACSSSPGNSSVYNVDASGTMVSTTVNGVSAQVTSTSSTNFAAPSQFTVGSQTTTLGWSSFLGLTNDTGPNGDSSQTFYDAFARPASTSSPFGAVTANLYNNPPYSSSSPATVTTVISDSGPGPYTTASGRWTRSTLDGFGRTILTETGDSSGTTLSQAKSVYGPCACSPMGKLMSQEMPHIVGGTPVSTVYTYDGLGRTLSVLLPDGASKTSYVYQGNTVRVTDRRGTGKSSQWMHLETWSR